MRPLQTWIVQYVIGLTVAVVGALSVSAQADTDKYIVRFKSEQIFKKQSERFQQIQAFQAQNQGSGVTLFNSTAVIERALDQVEMMIVASEGGTDIDRLRNHPAVAEIEAEIFYPTPKPIQIQRRGVYQRSAVEMLLSFSPFREVETPWGIHAVKADEAWTTTKGEGARVLVLDTGLDAAHPDLSSRFEKGQNFTSTNSSDFTDSIGHGTHVAGTIVADGDNSGLVGVAPRAKLLAGKVCGERGCSSAAIISGIDWGIQEKVDVISMSLGGPMATPSQQRAVQRADQANVIVVAASGNDGARRISYPAGFPTVFAVGAVGLVNGEIKRADFSQYGPGLDIVAPGVDVVSSVPRGAGRVSSVKVDFGDGQPVRVKSSSLQGAPENEEPISGRLVFAGLGKPDDIKNVVLRGKFALIQRGEITFKEKVVNAMNAGATGVVIYNNTNGVARGGLGEDANVRIPVAMIEKAVGERLKEAAAQGRSASAAIQTEKSDYDSYDGTSMATPHVSGVVALVRSAAPNLTPSQVRQILSETAYSMGNTDEYGSGLVDAAQAVAKAKLGSGGKKRRASLH